MTLDSASLEKLVESGDVHGLLEAGRGLDDRQRRALSRPLQAYLRQWLVGPEWTGGSHDAATWARRREQAAALPVAGALCLSTPTAVVSYLTRFSADWGLHSLAPLREALRQRSQTFRADLALRIAATVRPAEGWRGELAEALFAETGVAPPAHDGFVCHWIDAVGRQAAWWTDEPPVTLVDALRTHPLTSSMLPLLFEVDGAGSWLSERSSRGTWPETLATLAVEGSAVRSLLLTGCLRRLLRGGRPAGLRGYLRIYEALAPDLDDIASRARDLVRLLPDAPTSVAFVAQQQLRQAETAGQLAWDTALEAVRLVLVRSDQKLVVAGLSWLEALAARSPDRLEEVLITATIAFGQPAVATQRRAVSIVEKRLSTVDDTTRSSVIAAAAELPVGLRTCLGALSSTTSVVHIVPASPDPHQRPMPEPIATVPELAEELATILDRAHEQDIDPVRLERVLAALVAFAHEDRAALRTGLDPVRDRHRIQLGRGPDYHWDPCVNELMVMIAAAVGPIDDTAPDRAAELSGEGSWLRVSVPLRMLLLRMREAADALTRGPVPALVATPTERSGHLDAAVLLGRLERAAREGWEPLRYDLEQALLRLPHTVEPALVARADALETEAGWRLADWVRHGGLPTPTIRTRVVGVPVVIEPDTTAPQARVLPRSIGARLFKPLSHTVVQAQAKWFSCWPLMLPSHPDIISAHLVRHFMQEEPGLAVVLPALAEAGGPVGPAFELALAYGLGAASVADRAAAVDALLALSGRGQHDGTQVGAEIGQLAADGVVKLSRVVPALRDALNAGAARLVWTVVAGALPSTVGGTAPRLADLLVLGFDAAEASGARGIEPALAMMATAGGKSQVATEARRLHHLLTQE